jgi:predicted protein tyrosine phosphatase
VDHPGVQVFGEHELMDRILKGKKVYSHCISIRSPDQQMHEIIRDGFQEVLELKFYDVEREAQLPDTFADKRAPRLEDARAVIDFVNATRSVATGYTLHCWHGHSRSTAAAMGVLFMLLGSEKLAEDYLVRVRPEPKPSPNGALLAFFDNLLGSHLIPHGQRLQDEFIAGLRRELLETLWPADEVEELPLIEESGLLRKAIRMKGLA